MAAVKKNIEQSSKQPSQQPLPKEPSRGYFKLWWEIITEPVSFYEKIPTSLVYRQPTIFALKTSAFILAILFIIIGFMALMFAAMKVASSSSAPFTGVAGVVFLILLIGYPILLLFSWGMLYVWSGIIHLFAQLLGAKQGFKETFVSVCYSTAPQLVLFIPLVGSAAGIYSYVLQGIGLHKRQKMTPGKAAAAIIIPVGILMIVVIGLYVVYFLYLFSAMRING